MQPSFISELQNIVGAQYSLSDRESLAVYGYDSTPELESLPGVVVLPGNNEEVARIMRLCHGAGDGRRGAGPDPHGA